MIPNWGWNWESWHNSGQSKIWYCGQSAGKGRTVRQRTADGPPVLGRFYQRQFQSVGSVKKFNGGRSARISRTVRDWTERWGRPDLTYIGCHSHSHPPNRTQTSKSSLSFSLKHVGETTRSRLFGVVPGRSEHILGLFLRLCIMSSRYFNESLTLVLGFLYWKELGLDAPIYFWTMDSWKYLGILFLVMRRCYSLILVGGFESKLKMWVNQRWGRFCVPAQNRWVADSPPAGRGRSAVVVHEPRTVRVQKCGRSASIRFFRSVLNWALSLRIDSMTLVIVLMVKSWSQATPEDHQGHCFKN